MPKTKVLKQKQEIEETIEEPEEEAPPPPTQCQKHMYVIVCMYVYIGPPSPTPPGSISFTQFKDTQLMKRDGKIEKTTIRHCFA